MDTEKHYLNGNVNKNVIVDGIILPEKDAKKIRKVLKGKKSLQEDEQGNKPVYLKG